MDILKQEDRDNFVHSIDNGLWWHWMLLILDVKKFYSLKESDYDEIKDEIFAINLIQDDENDIELFREKFKNLIESNNGKFKKLTPFPEYFHPRDKKIRNIELDVLRVKLLMEKKESKRTELLEKINKIEEFDNPNFKALSKIEEAEHCFFWAVNSIRFHYKDDKMKDFIGLPRATFLHGYACGLLQIDGGVYTKLNEEKTAQELGGNVLKNKAQQAKQRIIELWNDRFNNPNLTQRQKTFKATFARYIYDNPSLITDNKGEVLKKKNGESWYTSPNTISGFLP